MKALLSGQRYEVDRRSYERLEKPKREMASIVTVSTTKWDLLASVFFICSISGTGAHVLSFVRQEK
jgi:hypothetical protein